MFLLLIRSAFCKEIIFIITIPIFILLVNANKTQNVLKEKSSLITFTATNYHNNLKSSSTHLLTNNLNSNRKNINQKKENELINKKQQIKRTTIWPKISTTEQYLQVNSTKSKTLFKHPGNYSNQIQVLSFCNGPGRPPKSQLTPIQLIYVENEQISYSCNEFISLKQFRKCIKGKWTGDFPLCGDALRDNDLAKVVIYKAEHGFPTRLLYEYNLTDRLVPFHKFGNSFIAERYNHPVRAFGSQNYYWNLILTKPVLIQVIRLSFSIVNHLFDLNVENYRFDVVSISINQHRQCFRVANHSVSPWHYNSTRLDYWYFCRAKSQENFLKEITKLSNMIRVETSSDQIIKYDLASLIIAEQYLENNNKNSSQPFCGLPEIPVGLQARVIKENVKYAFTCDRNYKRIDGINSNDFFVLQCGYDNRWHGSLPQCYPIRTCDKINLENSNFRVQVYKYDRAYYVNDSYWLPIRGTRAFFRCKDETDTFVGKEILVCNDGNWSSSIPNCLKANNIEFDSSFRPGIILIIIFTTMIMAFLFFSCMIYLFLKFRNSTTQISTTNNFNRQLKNESVTKNSDRVFVLPELKSEHKRKYQNGDIFEIIDNSLFTTSTSFKNGLNRVNSANLVQFDQYPAAVFHDDSPYIIMKR